MHSVQQNGNFQASQRPVSFSEFFASVRRLLQVKWRLNRAVSLERKPATWTFRFEQSNPINRNMSVGPRKVKPIGLAYNITAGRGDTCVGRMR